MFTECACLLRGARRRLFAAGGWRRSAILTSGAGRATPYIAAHIPGEIDKHLSRLADDYRVAERVVPRLFTTRILPTLPRLANLEATAANALVFIELAVSHVPTGRRS